MDTRALAVVRLMTVCSLLLGLLISGGAPAQAADRLARFKHALMGATMAEVGQMLGVSADEGRDPYYAPVWFSYTSIYTGKTFATNLAAHRRWRYRLLPDGRLGLDCRKGQQCLGVYFYDTKVYDVVMLPRGE